MSANKGLQALEEKKKKKAADLKARTTPIKGPAYMPFMAALGRKVSPALTPGRHIARLDSISLIRSEKTSRLFGKMTWITHTGAAGTIQLYLPDDPDLERIYKKNCGLIFAVLKAADMAEITNPNWKQVAVKLRNTLFSIELTLGNKGYINLHSLEVIGVVPDADDVEDNQNVPDGDTTGENAEEQDDE